jgi:hypothetical protein
MKLASTRRKILSTAASGLAVVGMTQTAGAQNESQNTTSDGNTTTSENTTNTGTETDSGGNTTSSDDDTNSTSDGDETTSGDEEDVSEGDSVENDTQETDAADDGDEGEGQTETEDTDSGDTGSCTGAPTMSRTSITTPQESITAETPATVEANFRVDPTVPEECTVNIDLQYSFAQSGFQFGGGSGWEQSATDIVATTFDDLQSGEIRSINAQIHTNGAEVGDEVTVIADYEIWYEGNREESFQQSGIRETVEVEAVNEPSESSEDGGSEEESEETTDGTEIDVPGFGIPSSIAAVGSVGYMIKRRLDSNE